MGRIAIGQRLGAVVAASVLAAACGKSSSSSAAAASGRADSASPQAATASTSAMSTVPEAAAVGGADGRAVFMRTCVTCHQQNGEGIQGAFPPLAENPVVAGDKVRLVRLLLHGLTGPVMVKGQRYNNVMPPWKSLTDAEMAAVLTFVRSNFGNTADAVTEAEVAAQRAATASRRGMWTARELDLE
jgi:mono/diheme cytochrome c family protein